MKAINGKPLPFSKRDIDYIFNTINDSGRFASTVDRVSGEIFRDDKASDVRVNVYFENRSIRSGAAMFPNISTISFGIELAVDGIVERG